MMIIIIIMIIIMIVIIIVITKIDWVLYLLMLFALWLHRNSYKEPCPLC